MAARRRAHGRHAAAPARTVRLRLPAGGRYAGRRRRTRRLVSRLAVGALLLPVAVGAGAPAEGPPVARSGAGAVLTRALSVSTAETVEPVASVTVLTEGQPVRPMAVASRGVPGAALRAYAAAEATLRVADPACRLRWSLLAGIGQVESRHGDGGVRRLGPMQFVPATWQVVGVDADGDDERDPRDIDDAALAAAAYLCAGPGDLGTARGAREAVVAYNRSPGYAALVVDLSAAYGRRVEDLPAVATAALPTGGVRVGVGEPGDGVLVGGSDNVAPPSERARSRRPEPADRPRARTGRTRRQDRSPRRPAVERSGPRANTEKADEPERDRPRATPSPRSAGPSPSPRPTAPTPRKPAPKPKPSPKPSQKPSQKPPASPGQSYTGTGLLTVANGVVTFHDDATAEDLTLTWAASLAGLHGKTVTVTGIRRGNSVQVTAPPVVH